MLESYIEELKSIRSAILKLTADPTANESISTPNGGSRSATYIDLAKLHVRERELIALIAELHRGGIGLSYPVYC